MKRKYSMLLAIVFSFIFLGNDFDVYSQPHNQFSYSNITERNLDNGNSLWLPEHYENLFNKQKVNKMTVYEINGGKEDLKGAVVYQNGLPIINAFPDDATLSRNYEYDDKGRLVRYDPFFYEYPEKDSGQLIERRRYFNGDFQQTEKIEVISSGYRVLVEEKGGYTRSCDFIFENNLLRKINTYLGGSPSLRYEFEYENGNIKKIALITSRGIVRTTRTITERDGENIISMESTDDSYSIGTVFTYKFYNYDRYGNWSIAESYRNDTLVEKYIRNIEYID